MKTQCTNFFNKIRLKNKKSAQKIIGPLGNQSGHFLLEALLGLSLLGAIIYSSTSIMGKANASAIQDRRRWIAAETASMVMEELSFSYLTSNILDAGTHTRYYNSSYSIVPKAQATFTATWEVAENTPQFGVMTISLAVSWTEGPREHKVRFETLR